MNALLSVALHLDGFHPKRMLLAMLTEQNKAKVSSPQHSVNLEDTTTAAYINSNI